MREAASRIADIARRTPLKPSHHLSRRLGIPVHLKLETMQDTGAFKVRGAASAILNIPERTRSRGVVAVSSGNHGRAVAWVARRLGIPAVICLTRLVPAIKVEAIRSLGAEVLIDPADQVEATQLAQRLAGERGLTYVDPFDERDVIAGQGTIALELLEQRPQLTTLLVPVGGGGLISGIALTVQALSPTVRVVGITNDRHPAMYECLRAGRIVPVEEAATLADALPGAIGDHNRYTFSLCQRHVEAIHLVEEAAIARAMSWAVHRERLVLEGSAAVGLAALLSPPAGFDPGGDVAVVCTGDNVDTARLLEIAREIPDP